VELVRPLRGSVKGPHVTISLQLGGAQTRAHSGEGFGVKMIPYDAQLHGCHDKYLEVVTNAADCEKTAMEILRSEGPPKTEKERIILEEMLQMAEQQPALYRHAANAWASRDLRIYRAFKRYISVGEDTVQTLRELLR